MIRVMQDCLLKAPIELSAMSTEVHLVIDHVGRIPKFFSLFSLLVIGLHVNSSAVVRIVKHGIE